MDNFMASREFTENYGVHDQYARNLADGSAQKKWETILKEVEEGYEDLVVEAQETLAKKEKIAQNDIEKLKEAKDWMKRNINAFEQLQKIGEGTWC
jgi:hypothetical protein